MTKRIGDRFVFGLEGPELTARERELFGRVAPFGFVLFGANLVSAAQSARLVTELRALGEPAPLLFVDQEGGPVDRLGPLLGHAFPSPTDTSAKGTDRVHECAYLMGRAARLLGFDVDLAPVLDLGQPGTGAVVLKGRTFSFFPEDVTLAGMVFVHGLKRAGLASCLKHFPGLGRGGVDTHVARPVVDAHDVDLMVTDVAPFTKLAGMADGVMVGHGAYPGFTEDHTPASLSPRIHRILRGPVGFDGVVYSDDLAMNALTGTNPERAVLAAQAGCDVLLLSGPFDDFEEAAARVAESTSPDPERQARLDTLRRRCASAPRPAFEASAWETLRDEVATFLDVLSKPRPKRPEPED